MKHAELRRQGALTERAAVLAWFDKIARMNARLAEGGCEASRLTEHRITALREAISSGVHEGEAAREILNWSAS